MENQNMVTKEAFSIEDLPEEVLEFILSLISPYKDLHDCMLVCKKWKRCVLNVVKTKQRNFQKAINEFDVDWERVTPIEMAPTITKRYSHTAVVHDNSMYVFGGCTSAMTTFNDLWRLDLSKRKWIRPLAMGTYPSPKACSSLIHYRDLLVLFGGWTYPPSYPLYQSWHLFNELHVYDIPANRWTCISTVNTPPPVAGHSVSVLGEWMIIFGGLQKPSSAVHCEKSNDIWRLNLETWTWFKQEVQVLFGGWTYPPSYPLYQSWHLFNELHVYDIPANRWTCISTVNTPPPVAGHSVSVLAGPKPNGRFGQTQIILDDNNLLILGGSGGPTMQYCDCWILNMEGHLWKWIKVEILGKQNEPSNIWSNPGCKIGDKIVVLNRIKHNEESPIVYFPRSQWNQTLPEDGRLSRIDLANRRQDVDVNVNGKWGVFLKNPKREVEEEDDRFVSMAGPSGIGANIDVRRIHGSHSLNMAAFTQPPSLTVHSAQIREKRLGKLQKMEEMLKKSPSMSNKKEKRTHYLGVYVLDISQVVTKRPRATWLPPKNVNNGPEETILYTLVEGKSELIMFGGIQKDANSLAPCNLSSQISNSLHFVTSPSYVI